jgi:hypothetical protein
MSLSCECCVLSGRGLCDELVHSSRVLPSVVCLKCVIAKPRKMRRRRPPRGCGAIGKKEKMKVSSKFRTVQIMVNLTDSTNIYSTVGLLGYTVMRYYE